MQKTPKTESIRLAKVILNDFEADAGFTGYPKSLLKELAPIIKLIIEYRPNHTFTGEELIDIEALEGKVPKVLRDRLNAQLDKCWNRIFGE
jgi:hypothetical protein